MTDQKSITVEVILALPHKQQSEKQQLQKGITLQEALPFFTLYHQGIALVPDAQFGIFNQIVTPHHPLEDGDRIELYRPLIIDPKESRRIRPERQAAIEQKRR